MKKFKINDFITLKLENDETIIYIKNEKFIQCKFLMMKIPIKEISTFDSITSIDEAEEFLDGSMENYKEKKVIIPPECEFWGHCSVRHEAV